MTTTRADPRAGSSSADVVGPLDSHAPSAVAPALADTHIRNSRRVIMVWRSSVARFGWQPSGSRFLSGEVRCDQLKLLVGITLCVLMHDRCRALSGLKILHR